MLFGRGDPTLESVVDASNFALFCTPAINLFAKRADRIHVTDGALRVPRRRRPDPAAGLRDLRGHRASSATASATDSEQQFLPFYSAYSTDAEHQQSAYFTTRREPRLVSSDAEAARLALELHRHRGVPVAGRSGAGAVQRRPAAAVDPGAVHQSRSRAADADRHRHRPTSRSTSRRRSRASAWSAARAVRTRRWPTARSPGGRSATCRSTICRWSTRRRRKARRRCASCSSCTRRAPTSARRRQIEGIRSVQRRAGRAPAAGAAGRWRSAAASRSPSTVDEMAFEGGSAFLLARCWIDTSRATCRSTRSPKPCCDRRVEAKSIDGCRNGARDRRCSVLRRAGGGAVPLRLLPDAAAARVPVRDKPRWGDALRPVDEPVRLGQDPDLSFAPAPLASFELGQDGAAAAPAGQAVRPARPERPAADPHHRVRARAAAPRRRSDAQPVPRSLPSPVPGAVLSRLGAGAAARQPRSPGATIASRSTSARSSASRRRRCAIATRVPDVAKLFHAGALVRQVRNAEGLARDPPAVLPRAGADRGVRRPLDARSAPRERTYLRARRRGARLGRGARRARVGPPAQVPHPARTADAARSTRAFLPPAATAGVAAQKLVDWVRLYLCFELDWDVRLHARRRTRCRALTLGTRRPTGLDDVARHSARPTTDADDLCLRCRNVR